MTFLHLVLPSLMSNKQYIVINQKVKIKSTRFVSVTNINTPRRHSSTIHMVTNTTPALCTKYMYLAILDEIHTLYTPSNFEREWMWLHKVHATITSLSNFNCEHILLQVCVLHKCWSCSPRISDQCSWRHIHFRSWTKYIQIIFIFGNWKITLHMIGYGSLLHGVYGLQPE